MSPFRPRERVLVAMVLATFGLVCFAAVFYLPDRQSPENKVYRVYHELKEAGRDLMLPAPPFQKDEMPPVRGHHEDPAVMDVHKVNDKAKLQAQVELDQEIQEMHRKQFEQIPKPNIKPPPSVHSPDKPGSPNNPDSPSISLKPYSKESQGNPVDLQGQDPVVFGGEDHSVAAKRDKIKEMMTHAWKGYEQYAWGQNELRPLTRRGHSASIFGNTAMGATIIDALDTLYIMGMHEEFKKGRDWVEENLNFERMSGDISVFETNIRYIGGLLSAYALSGDELFKDKAASIADKLMPAFKSPTGIPYALVNMRTGTAKNFAWASGGSSILSEFGTLHMEFAYLSDVTGDPKFRDAVVKVRKVIKNAKRPKSLYPNYLNPRTGNWGQRHTSVGALGDSFYEYLLKEWLRSGKEDLEAKTMFDLAALDIEKFLIKKSESGLTYIAEMKYDRLEHKMDHLACFAGGMYGLAAAEEQDSNSQRWMEVAKGITETCHESYQRTETKLGPEAFRFSNAVEARSVRSTERYYILRPETVESYFVLWRLTGDQKYRDWGWQFVEALEKHCRVESGGYTGIKNVYQSQSPKDDVQQSFFLAETLKYLYLLFSDDSLIARHQWVLNSEAHPLPIKGQNTFYRPAKP